MSERRFGVVLAARVDQYVAAMQAAKQATSGFSATTQKILNNVGTKMVQVGKAMTVGVSAPLVGLGTLAGKMSMDFERAFSEMVGLADVPAHEVARLKSEVLSLSSETGVSAQLLAEALYSAASAGLTSSQALDAVTAAAYAQAAGLGVAEDVVGLAASAIASYGAETMNAAKATDILTATIRAGRADPDELAGTLGRILPIAAQLGVSFEEVGGLTAYLSNVMGHTGRTVTSLSGFFAKLVSPTKQGREALVEMGTSMTELQRIIRQDGILAALEHLRERGFGGNQLALRRLFDDVEAFQGALALINDRSGTLTSTLTAVANSTGALGEAFGEVADDDGFKLRRGFEQIRNALIQLGDLIIPIAGQVAELIGKMAEGFSHLPTSVQYGALALGAFVAAAGPLIMAAGAIVKVVSNLQLIMMAVSHLGPALMSAVPWLAAIASVGVAAYAVWDNLTRAKRQAAQRTKELIGPLQNATQAIIQEAQAARDAKGSIDGLTLAQDALSRAILDGSSDADKTVQALGELGYQVEDVSGLLLKLRGDPLNALKEMARHAGATAEEAALLAEIVNKSDKPFWGFYESTNRLTPELVRLGKAMEELQDQAENMEVEELARQILNVEAASSAAKAGLIETARALEGNGATSWEVYQRYLELAAGAKELAGEAEGVGQQGRKVSDVLRGLGDAAGDAAGDLGELAAMDDALQEAMQAAAEAALAYRQVLASEDWGASAFKGATTAFDEYRESLFGLGNFIQSKTVAYKEFAEAVGKGALNLDTATEAGMRQQDALEKVAAVIDTQLARAWEEAAGDAEVFRARATEIADEALADLRKQAGLSKKEVEELARALGLTPEEIETRIKLAGDAEARIKLGLLQGLMSTLDADVQMDIQMMILEGDYQGAVARLQRALDGEHLDVDLDAKPGDTRTAHRTTQRWYDNNPWSGKVNARQGDWSTTWSKMKGHFDGRPVSSPVNARQGTWSPTWQSMRSYFDARPVSAKVNAVLGNLSNTWQSIQNWFSRNPVSVSVRTVGGGGGGGANAPRAMATGGVVGPHEPFQLVGEKGPELVKLPPGSRVYPADETSRILQSAGRLVSARELGLPVQAAAPASSDPLIQIGTLQVGDRSALTQTQHTLDDLLWKVKGRR